MRLPFRHLVSAGTLTRADVEAVLDEAARMEKVLEKGGDDRLKGRILASLFYEPSTRTRMSFEAAMMRLGGNVITADGMSSSSLKKGETIEDTIRMAASYADAIVMRHPEEGAAAKAAAVSAVPFLNGGDGPGEHPTQALLDVYTMRKERGGLENLHVAFVGDLKFGRTLHSTTQILSLFPGVRMTFVAPPELVLPPKVRDVLSQRGVAMADESGMEPALAADVLYMTRIQSERFSDPAEYARLKDVFRLEAKQLKGRGCTVMHPLPRVGEIAEDVDALPNAAYFRQAANGVPVRMALLSLLLS